MGSRDLVLHVVLLYLIPDHNNTLTIPSAFRLQGCKWLLTAVWNKAASQR